jgi:hypothetical protein
MYIGFDQDPIARHFIPKTYKSKFFNALNKTKNPQPITLTALVLVCYNSVKTPLIFFQN